MAYSTLPWGYHDFSEAHGAYQAPIAERVRREYGVILTAEGEVLVRRTHADKEACAVAILIDRAHRGLSSEQSRAIQKAWDAARALAGGDEATIDLEPQPMGLRLSRTEYVTLDEWQPAQGSSCGCNCSETRPQA